MDWNHHARLYHSDRPESIFRAHGEVVPDGKDRKVYPVVAKQSHVAKQAGVARKVKRFFLGLKQESAWASTARPIGKTGAVQGQGEL